MKAVNEGSMLVAQALEKLKILQCQDCTQYPGAEEIVKLLELALEKLVSDIS